MPCVAEVVNRSLKADCTDFTRPISIKVYHNKQSLETAGSNYERAFSDFVQALVKLDRLRRLYFFTTAIVQRWVHWVIRSHFRLGVYLV